LVFLIHTELRCMVNHTSDFHSSSSKSITTFQSLLTPQQLSQFNQSHSQTNLRSFHLTHYAISHFVANFIKSAYRGTFCRSVMVMLFLWHSVLQQPSVIVQINI